MANNVFANGREISCKSGEGKSICAFPDVCMTPPENPATPPGVPVPYPNTGMANDTTSGSRQVQISGKETMLKNKSYFKKSTGDEAGSAAKKGVVTSVNRGKVYFVAWSMDVQIEGENAVRHLDLMTHNHASPGSNTSTWPNLDKMSYGKTTCKEIFEKEGINVHRHGDKNCPKGYDSDHILQNACFENSRGAGGISTAPDYASRDAPCICLYDNTRPRTQHGKKTAAQRRFAKALRRKKKKTISYKKVRDANLDAIKPTPSKAARACLKKVVDSYFKKKLKLKEKTPVRVPRTGKFRRPPAPPRG